MELNILCLTVLTIFALLDGAKAHVTLTYPWARKYGLDFLDVIRTPGPCGMSKGLGPYTTLEANTVINVTWHIAYPHRGGYRIQLLDQNEQVIHRLTDGFVGRDNPTQLHHEIRLPDIECLNCTIQLMREAGEWGAGVCNGGKYDFYTCADVDIVKSINNITPLCSDNGYLHNRVCRCDRFWSGPQCQYRDECEYDTDCGTGGECIEISTTYPKKQCFCAQGYFGSNCRQNSPVTRINGIEFSNYVKTTTTTDEFEIYHRVLQDLQEIEIILRVKTDTWVAIGWRPAGFRSGCQLFPELPPFPDRPVRTTPEPEGESTPEPEGESTPEPEGESTPEPEGDSTPEPEGESKPEPEGESTPEPEGESTPEPEGESTPEPEGTTAEPEPTYDGRWCPGVDSCAGAWAEITWIVVDSTLSFTVSVHNPGNKFYSDKWIALGLSKDQSMLDSDVFAAFVSNGSVATVLDMFIPKDPFQKRPFRDVDEDVTFRLRESSSANGKLKFSFYRRLRTGDEHDVQIYDEKLYLLFAHGSTVGGDMQYHGPRQRWNSARSYCFSPGCLVKTTPEPEGETTPEPEGETTPEPEGETTPEPEGETTPEPEGELTPEPEGETTPEPGPKLRSGEWCPGVRTCTNDWARISWITNISNIIFTITVDNPSNKFDSGKWIAVGISKTQSMTGSDVFIAFLVNGTVVSIQDMYIPQDIKQPNSASDFSHITSLGSRSANGKLTYSFRRPLTASTLDTSGDRDIEISSEKLYLLFAHGTADVTGNMQYNEENMRYHGPRQRWYSSEAYCLAQWCEGETTPEPEGETTPEPEGETTPEPEGESTPEPEEESTPEPEGETTPEPEGESTPEPEGETTPEPEGETTPEPEGETTPEPEGETTPEPEGETTPEPEGETTPEPEGETTPEPEGGSTPDPEGEPTDNCGIPPTGAYDPFRGGGVHAMDCTDIIVGAARGSKSRIFDYYTRDRSTPMRDEFYNGVQSLTAAIGEEKNGYTTILFRRKLKADAYDHSDHSITNSSMHVIWARGQRADVYYHRPAAGIDNSNLPISDPNYYKRDELKYHGNNQNNNHRGRTTVNFFDIPVKPNITTCDGEWSAPSGNYKAAWVYNDLTRKITIVLEARLSGTQQQWLAIGFNSESRMVGDDSDSYIAWVTSNGTATVSDRFNRRYLMPAIDATQNVEGVSGNVVNGVTRVTFTRAIDTGDSNEDFIFSGTNCAYILFSWGGNVFEVNNEVILTRHIDEKVSDEKLCIPGCGQPDTCSVQFSDWNRPQTSCVWHTRVSDVVYSQDIFRASTTTTKSKPSTTTATTKTARTTSETVTTTTQPGQITLEREVTFNFMLRNVDFVAALENKRTLRYKELERDMLDLVVSWLQALQGFGGVRISKFSVGVQVEAVVRLTRSGTLETIILSNMKIDLQTRLREMLATGAQNGYSFDTGLLVYDPVPVTPPEPAKACEGEWLSPSFDYLAIWTVDTQTNKLMITMEAKLSQNQQEWLAIGFNDRQSMDGPKADSYIAWVSGNQVNVSDRHNQRKSEPTVDPTQNIDTESVSRRVEDGTTRVSFTRDLNTGDNENDFIFDGTNCAYFLFAWGGRVFLDGIALGAHRNKYYSDKTICFRQCDATATTPSTKSTQSTATTRLPPTTTTTELVTITIGREVPIGFRITNVGFVPGYTNTATMDYKNLEQGVLEVVDTSRDGSVQVSAAVELERSGTSIQSIEEEMKSDVTKKVRNMVASGIQNGYVFAPGEYTVQDPTLLPTITGQCSGEWSANTGDYTAIWSYDDESDEISFTLEAAVAQDEWMAIGINTLPQMFGTSGGPVVDSFIAWMDENEQAHISDRSNKGYISPLADEVQNVKLISGSISGGRTRISFTRGLVTGDNENDFAFDGSECAYFIFAWGGRVFNNGDVLTHHRQTHVSETQFCFPECAVKVTIDRDVSFGLKLQNVTFIDDFNVKSSSKYKELERNVLDMLTGWFLERNVITSNRKMRIDRFRSGSTWVDATATLTKSGASEQDIEAEMKTSVFEAVKDLVATGAHDGFTFVQGDQNVFVNNPKPVHDPPTDEEEEEEGLTKLGKIIIGISAAAFVFLLILVFGTIVKKMRAKDRKTEYMVDKKGFKPYKDTSYFVSPEALTGASKANSVTFKQWTDSFGRADASKVGTNYVYSNQVKVQPEKTQFVKIKDAVPNNDSHYVIYDNPVKQPVTNTDASSGGSVVRIQRNPQDGSYYMRSDGKVKYVFR